MCLNEIVRGVQRVNDIIGEISSAAAEQSDGISQVNVAVSQLDRMTQQNGALVGESTAAADNLRNQAQRLAELIAVFQINAAAQGRLVRPVRPGMLHICTLRHAMFSRGLRRIVFDGLGCL